MGLSPTAGKLAVIERPRRLSEVNREIEALVAQATQGDARAQFRLGAEFALGGRIDQDYVLARFYLSNAASQGHMQAQFQLGQLYRLGLGNRPNPERACTFYRLAAEQGHGNARFALAYAYFVGEGVDLDYSEAFLWFSLATRPSSPEDRILPAHRIAQANRYLRALQKVAHPLDLKRGEAKLAEWVEPWTR